MGSNARDEVNFFRIRGDLYVRRANVNNLDLSGLSDSEVQVVNSVLSRPKNWPLLASARPTARELRISEAVATIAYRRQGDNVEYAVSFKDPSDQHGPKFSRDAARGRLLKNRGGKDVVCLNLTPGLSRREMQQCIVRDIMSAENTPTIYRRSWVREMFDL